MMTMMPMVLGLQPMPWAMAMAMGVISVAVETLDMNWVTTVTTRQITRVMRVGLGFSPRTFTTQFAIRSLPPVLVTAEPTAIMAPQMTMVGQSMAA